MDKAERDIAETAYWFRSFGRYGTQSKALTALLKRKSMVGRNSEQVANQLQEAILLHDRTLEHVSDVLSDAKRSYHCQLTRQQFVDGTERIRQHLIKEFPGIPDSIDYMLAMLWHMPHVR